MENKKISNFQALLLFATILIVAGAVAFGFIQRKGKLSNIEAYNQASSRISRVKSMPGGASQDTVDKLNSDIELYNKSLSKLSKELSGSTGIEFKNIEPREFSAKVSKTHSEMLNKFKAKGVRLPQDWYLGFEKYASVPAPKVATGKLSYTLEALTFIHDELLKHNPEALLNIARPPISEEIEGSERPRANLKDAKNNKNNPDAIVKIPVEISFIAKEANARAFINNLVSNDRFTFTIDTFKIEETKSLGNKEETKNDDSTNEEATPEDDDTDISSVFEEGGNSTPRIAYSDEKLFDQVLGQESLAVLLDLNLVYLPESLTPEETNVNEK